MRRTPATRSLAASATPLGLGLEAQSYMLGSSPGNLPITDGKKICVGNTIPHGKDAKIIITFKDSSRIIG